MKTFLSPRLRRPAVMALAGTAFAVAWLVRGGPSWFLSIVIEVTVLVRVVTMYIQSGREIKEGTRTAAGRDERQQMVSMRSRALAGSVMTVAAFIGLTVAVAIRANWWWPCAAILALALFSYLYGLSRFGVGEEGPEEDNDADSGYEARSQVNS
jgi:Ca2+/Na+ antiporter